MDDRNRFLRAMLLTSALLECGCASSDPRLVGTWRSQMPNPARPPLAGATSDVDEMTLSSDLRATYSRTVIFDDTAAGISAGCTVIQRAPDPSWSAASTSDGGTLRLASPTPTSTIERRGCREPSQNQPPTAAPQTLIGDGSTGVPYTLSGDTLTLRVMTGTTMVDWVFTRAPSH